MGNYSSFQMFENPRRGRQARNFTRNVPKILDLKSSSEHIFSENCRWVPLFDLLSLPHFALERDQTWGKTPQIMIVQKKSRFCQQNCWLVGFFAKSLIFNILRNSRFCRVDSSGKILNFKILPEKILSAELEDSRLYRKNLEIKILQLTVK